MSTNTSYQRLRDTVVDGRAENVFYRREQLRKLHDRLSEGNTPLLDAIVADSGNTSAEAWTELYQALAVLKTCFDGLDPEKALAEEYAIAKQQDSAGARTAVGIVYIEPTMHTVVFSVVSAVAAAIAAGNCVIVVLEKTPRQTPALLQQYLCDALDPDLLHIAPAKLDDAEFLQSCVRVIQEGSVAEAAAATGVSFVSPSRLLTVAIVDRTANIDDAARSLVAARFRYRGTSPYAPDLVLVDETAKGAFLNAVVRHSIKYLTADSSSSDAKKRQQRQREPNSRSIFDDASAAKIVTSGNNGSILDVTKRTALLKLQKISQPAILVHATTSMDDAINLANDMADKFLASYVFGAPDVCRYIINFIGSHLSLANHVQSQLLLGPAFPIGMAATAASALNPLVRYAVDGFMEPTPAYYVKPAAATELDTLLEGLEGPESGSTAVAAKKSAMLQSVTLNADRSIRHPIGFFEQGILTGLTLIGTPIILSIGALGYHGVRRIVLPALW
ncbi:hypothetical protein Sste5346_003916 [Sporothrix stenoceras]|uniref:Aldehyde dehydrogenase domain-containing protein n=1 Tax=Sporothrix stenoceras TaxID=5173 RepID=A0ABR3ZAD1_9PEZI